MHLLHVTLGETTNRLPINWINDAFVYRLYPVDMKRVNEFGVSYEDQENEDKPHKD